MENTPCTAADLKLAVFDCDGTLVDSQSTIIRTMAHAFAEHNQPSPLPEEVRRVIGLPLLEAIARLGVQLDSSVHEAIRASYARAFFDLRAGGDVHEPAFPGMAEALDALEASGWLLGIATGKSRRGLEATLEPYGWSSRFVTKQTSDVAAGKPNPDMLLRAMAETGIEPRNTVMIGDTTYDMLMARNAGVFAVGVAWGYHHPGELRDAGAHLIVERFADLENALHSLMEAYRCDESVGS